MEKIGINKGKKLGEGAERTVYEDLNNPDHVIGIFHEKKEEELKTKARFYLTKILHILLPDNIRDIHASYSDPNVTINSKVKQNSWKFWKKINYDPETLKEIRLFVNKLEEDLGVGVDSYYKNVMRDDNGNLVYVDSINPWGKTYMANFSPHKLKESIEKLDEYKKKKGLEYLERLISLANESGVKVLE
jgi:hypothetical protein